jgi:anti-sigma B factor antagonist
MLINKTSNGNELIISFEGRLDTMTAPELEAELRGLSDVKVLVVDMSKLVYVSSAGLRVLLKAQKIMNRQGSMKVKNISRDIREVFEITGFDELLNIEEV